MKLISDLKLDYQIKDIEKAFILAYLSINGLDVKRNKFIFEKVENADKGLLTIINSKYNELDIYDLVKVFELLIPETDKKINGAFFTPRIITEFIAKETIKNEKSLICDPSCGCGAFLIEAATYINKKFGKSFQAIIKDNLYGVDILDYSADRCKILLMLLALSNGENVDEKSLNIYQADSLGLDWEKKFKKVFQSGGFDTIIGNPPYVKFQDLPNDIRKNLYDNWTTLKKGSYNLYFAFFELGINLIKKDGVLGYITPNNYFTSLSGIDLRKFFSKNRYIDKIIDFNHLKLFEAQTYTCITFLSKIKKDNFLYERIDKKRDLEKLANLNFSKINYESLNDKKWRLLKKEDQGNINKIEKAGDLLGDLYDIRVGIATCKDIIYFIDGSTLEKGYYSKKYNGKIYKIEEDITEPIVKISDFKNQEELNKNKRRIIFPYRVGDNQANLILESELESKFPKAYKYLLDAREELDTRDKGKVSYLTWYAYARSQGLSFYGEKLTTPTFSSEPRFLYEENKLSLFCNGYAIFEKKKSDLFTKSVSLRILSKILNSDVMKYYIEKTSVSIEGGYPCYQKNFIELFSLPNFNNKDIELLERESDSDKINKFLVEKYNLNFI